MATRPVAGGEEPVTVKEKVKASLLRWKRKIAMKELDIDQAANVLAHYHLCHTQDKVTRVRCQRKGTDEPAVDIYIVADPEWFAKLNALTEEIFEPLEE